jgi:hypothetical protein
MPSFGLTAWGPSYAQLRACRVGEASDAQLQAYRVWA